MYYIRMYIHTYIYICMYTSFRSIYIVGFFVCMQLVRSLLDLIFIIASQYSTQRVQRKGT